VVVKKCSVKGVMLQNTLRCWCRI